LQKECGTEVNMLHQCKTKKKAEEVGKT